MKKYFPLLRFYNTKTYFPTIESIDKAYININSVFKPTPLEFHEGLSEKYESNILLKKENESVVRSYKNRGAFNKMSSLTNKNGIVTCSAGNHAQGVAYSCNKLMIPGDIFMPKITTKQKIDKVKKFGGNYVNIFLEGSNFDESFDIANNYSLKNKKLH